MGDFSADYKNNLTPLRLVGYDSIVVISDDYGADLEDTYATLNVAYTDDTITPTDGFLAENAYDSTLNLQGDQIEVTVKGDFSWRSYRSGFADATLNLSLRNDASGKDVQYLRARALDGKRFAVLFVDNYKSPGSGFIKMPVIITTANTAGDFQSSQDLTFELKPAQTSLLKISAGGSWAAKASA